MRTVYPRTQIVKALAKAWEGYKEVEQPDQSFTSGVESTLWDIVDELGIDIGEVMEMADAPTLDEMKRELIQYLGFDGNDFHYGMFDVAMRDKYDSILWHGWSIDRDHNDSLWRFEGNRYGESYYARDIEELTEIIAAVAYEEEDGDLDARWYLTERGMAE